MSTAMDPNTMQQNPGHQYFDPAKSTTYKGMLGNWTAGFAKGTMVQAGFRANETVNIGQVRTMDPIGFGGATDMNKHLWGANFSGNLGVSWLSSGSINNGISTNFMSWVRDSLSKPLLTLDCDSQRGEGYWMSIGSVDPLRYDGSLTVIPIMDQNVDSWTVQVRSYWIGGQMLGADSYTDSMPLTFDTAATSCTVHGDVAGDYWKQVPGATQAGDGTWVWPCLEPTPDFTIQWEEGSDWTMIPGKVLNNATRSIIMGNGNDCKSHLRNVGLAKGKLLTAVPAWCYGGLQNAADVRAVMGTPFFEGVYTSFDYHDATVSMAPYKGEGGNITNDIPGDVSGHATTPLSTAIDTSTAAAAGTETGSAAGTATQVGTSNTQPSASSGGSVQAGSSGQAATTAQTATTGQATTTAQAGSSTQPASAS